MSSLSLPTATQRLGVFQIGGVEALSEPTANLGERRAGLFGATGIPEVGNLFLCVAEIIGTR